MSEPTTSHHGLTSILLDAGVVTAAQVDEGLARQRETGLRIGETLVEIGAATEEDIGWALARQLGLPFVDLRGDTLDPDLLREFPAGLLYRLHAVPLLRSDDGLSIAFSDPTDLQASAHLEALAGAPIRPSVTTASAIRRVLAPLLGAHAAGTLAPHDPGPAGAVVWDRSGANFLHFHLHAARRAGATAVHFVPSPTGVSVYQRTPRGLARVSTEAHETFEALLTQLELLGAPVGDPGSLVQRSGHVECAGPGGPERLEVAVLAHGSGTSVTLRFAPEGGAPATLESLGLDPVDVARVRDALHRPAGLVLVCGPTGSGCTTTLACLLAEAARDERSAIVFGDLPGGRTPDGLRIELPSPDALAAWERVVTLHEPDVVVLDDAVRGDDVHALTAGAGMGRLVLARADWGDTFALLEHAAARPHSRSAMASRLLLVLQQRRIPAPSSAPGSGTRARFEVLVVSERLRDAIRAHASARDLRQLAEAEGFRGLDRVLADDVKAGLLDPDALARATQV